MPRTGEVARPHWLVGSGFLNSGADDAYRTSFGRNCWISSWILFAASSPWNSVARNSPVERSRAAKPTRSPVCAMAARKLFSSELEGRICGGAGGDDPRDFAPHQFLGQARIFDLLADRDLESLADQLRDVAFGGVVRHAAHGNGDAFFFVARGERDLQFFGGQDGVVEEKLVEISQAEEQQGAGMLLLDGGILPHQRRGRLGHFKRASCADYNKGCGALRVMEITTSTLLSLLTELGGLRRRTQGFRPGYILEPLRLAMQIRQLPSAESLPRRSRRSQLTCPPRRCFPYTHGIAQGSDYPLLGDYGRRCARPRSAGGRLLPVLCGLAGAGASGFQHAGEWRAAPGRRVRWSIPRRFIGLKASRPGAATAFTIACRQWARTKCWWRIRGTTGSCGTRVMPRSSSSCCWRRIASRT